MIIEMRGDTPGLIVRNDNYYKEKVNFDDAHRRITMEAIGGARRMLLDGRCIGVPKYLRWNQDGSKQWVGFEPVAAMIGGRA